MLDLILASQSARRRDLLCEAGYKFQVFTVKVSEIFDENLKPSTIASLLAERKSSATFEQHKILKSQGFLVLTSDTVVAVDGRVLGKPENTLQAEEYLRLLSGKTHCVISAIHLRESGSEKFWTGFSTTKVSFRQLSVKEIDSYVAGGEPMDKAGAYAIQGEGGKFVTAYEGSWSNVVGLPMELFSAALNENKWNVYRTTPAKP